MKFVVPQGIDAEDKILGPITVRQFLLVLVAGFFAFLSYKFLDFGAFVISTIFTAGTCVIFAFVKINDQPFHYFVLNMLQTFKRPALRIWNKELETDELRAALKEPPQAAPKMRFKKDALSETKLAELSLIVNTGGVYNPED
jgi:hypothetical protein